MMETDAQTGNRTNERAGPKAPAIVLVEPQLGENIGFAARAMGNFGLDDLRLVAPRDGWPNEKARAAAAVAEPIASGARVFGTVEEALADRNYVIATTARPREMVKPVLSPETAAAAIRKRSLSDERCAVMFGAERNGLDNDSIALADAILTAPVDPNFASLSLPQAVLLFSYEWMKSGAPTALGRATSFDGPAREGLATPGTGPASRAALFGLFAHMESALDAAGFLRPPEKRPAMVRSIRNMFHRMECTDQDVRTWRGIVSALTRRQAAPKG
ncbi:RNA methyltransferase [Methyloceanibacter sp.]|uniref:RNA methyltransferase n=1 Tax=Methyloceanibacter sp. TaxID=1965321 RepID=UPI002BFE7B27|nr:RNA methyltransferase [Methyloceanibacter sp.]HML92609.1 RNA methyltransferase [Methyloceanibacter sp.]